MLRVRGRIVLGNGVRIGAHSSLLGFNHGFSPARPRPNCPVPSTPSGCVPCRIPPPDWSPSTPRRRSWNTARPGIRRLGRRRRRRVSRAVGGLRPGSARRALRLTRGSFAQFGVRAPYAEQTVDTVMAHGRDPRWFAPGRENACDVLDVAHPLWLAGRQSGHRAAEARAWAEERLTRALDRRRDGAGFGPAGEGSGGPGREPGLQGAGCGSPSSGCWPA